MIDRHKYNVAFAGEIFAMVSILFNSIAVGIATAVQPNHNRAFLAIINGRCPYVEFQAVLADVVVIPVVYEGPINICIPSFHILGRSISPPYGWQNLSPRIRFLWWHEAVRAGSISAMRNPEEGSDPAQHESFYF